MQSGNTEPVEGRPKVVVDHEDNGQSKNYASVRRINLPQNEKEDITEKATVRALDVGIRAAEIPCPLRSYMIEPLKDWKYDKSRESHT